MSNRLINELFAFPTTVVDNSDTDYKYTGIAFEFGALTSSNKWLIIKERKTDTDDTQGTTVYSNNPFSENRCSSVWNDRVSINYNNSIDIEA